MAGQPGPGKIEAHSVSRHAALIPPGRLGFFQTGDDEGATPNLPGALTRQGAMQNERGNAPSFFEIFILGQFHIVTLGKELGRERPESGPSIFHHGSITAQSFPFTAVSPGRPAW